MDRGWATARRPAAATCRQPGRHRGGARQRPSSGESRQLYRRLELPTGMMGAGGVQPKERLARGHPWRRFCFAVAARPCCHWASPVMLQGWRGLPTWPVQPPLPVPATPRGARLTLFFEPAYTAVSSCFLLPVYAKSAGEERWDGQRGGRLRLFPPFSNHWPATRCLQPVLAVRRGGMRGLRPCQREAYREQAIC